MPKTISMLHAENELNQYLEKLQGPAAPDFDDPQVLADVFRLTQHIDLSQPRLYSDAEEEEWIQALHKTPELAGAMRDYIIRTLTPKQIKHLLLTNTLLVQWLKTPANPRISYAKRKEKNLWLAALPNALVTPQVYRDLELMAGFAKIEKPGDTIYPAHNFPGLPSLAMGVYEFLKNPRDMDNLKSLASNGADHLSKWLGPVVLGPFEMFGFNLLALLTTAAKLASSKEKNKAKLWVDVAVISVKLILSGVASGIMIALTLGASALAAPALPFLIAAVCAVSAFYHMGHAAMNFLKWRAERDPELRRLHRAEFVSHGLNALFSGLVTVAAVAVVAFPFMLPILSKLGVVGGVMGMGRIMLHAVVYPVTDWFRKRTLIENRERQIAADLASSPAPKKGFEDAIELSKRLTSTMVISEKKTDLSSSTAAALTACPPLLAGQTRSNVLRDHSGQRTLMSEELTSGKDRLISNMTLATGKVLPNVYAQVKSGVAEYKRHHTLAPNEFVTITLDPANSVETLKAYLLCCIKLGCRCCYENQEIYNPATGFASADKIVLGGTEVVSVQALLTEHSAWLKSEQPEAGPEIVVTNTSVTPEREESKKRKGGGDEDDEFSIHSESSMP